MFLDIIKNIANVVISFYIKGDKQPVMTVPAKNGDEDILGQGVSISIDEGNIIVDYSPTEMWHKGWKRNLEDIIEVVIHHTESNMDENQTIEWIKGGERSAEYKRGVALFSFLLGQTGHLVKLGPLSRWWYHSSSRNHDSVTVGIEVCNRYESFTDAQIKMLWWFLFDYIPYHCPNFKRVVGHSYNEKIYSGTNKHCPGKGMPWGIMEQEMTHRGIVFKKIFDEAYEINV